MTDLIGERTANTPGHVRRAVAMSIASVLATAAPSFAHAGVLDWIRNYDLNNYSLGVTVAPSQSPYLDADNTLVIYPYLTSFTPSQLNDDWLIIRDGDLGVRWVNDVGWELGAVGRISTGGLGSGNPLALVGLNDRSWTIEVGPTIGWRRWPVHVYLKSYFEVLDRRDGTISELAFMYPREFEWGFLTPSYELVYQSQEYNDYYYGVSPQEANLFRSEYTPDESLNHVLKLRYGFRLAERWLLSGSVDYEILDDTIVDSPIVGRDSLWSASIGLAYDADIFQPRDFPYPEHEEPTVEFRVGAFFDNVNTTVKRGDDGIPGTPIDIEDALGLEEDGVLTQLDTFIRIGRFHRLELSYFEFGRSGQVTLEDDFTFGDLDLLAGSDVVTKVDTSVARFSYSYSLMKDFQKELGVTFGLHYTDMRVTINTAAGERERASTRSPLPVIGVHGSASFSDDWSVRAQIAGFWQEFDRYDGYLASATFDVVRRLGDRFSAGLGFNYYRLDVSSSRESLDGEILTEHLGPVVFLSASF